MAGELILVVDDGSINRKLYNRLLSREGYRVDTVTSAQEALAKLQTEQPRLILIDICLGGMDGLELTRRIRANTATRSITIIVMTAQRDEYDEHQVREAGADAFVTLPIDITAFVSLILSVLKTGDDSSVSEQKH